MSISFPSFGGWISQLIAGCITGLGWLRDWFGYALQWIVERPLLMLMMPLAFISWVGVYMWKMIMNGINFRDSIVSWFGMLGNAGLVSGLLVVWTWAEKINYLVPLDVMIWAAIILILWRMSIAIYHFVMSFVPVIAGD